MPRAVILVAAPNRSWPVAVESGRAVTVGKGRGADVRVGDPALADEHVVISVDDGGALTIEARGPAVLNGVQVSGVAQARSGDELSIGDTLLVFQRASDAPAEPVTVWPWEPFQWVVGEELARGAEGVLVLGRQMVPAGRRGQLADKLFGAFGDLPAKDGYASTDETRDVHELFALALTRLLGLPAELDEDEQLVQDAAMLRLLSVAERLAEQKASALIIGERGTGKWTFAKRLSPKGKAWGGESVAPAGSLLVRRADALPEREQLAAALRAGRHVVATATAPDDALVALFPHIISLPALRDRSADVEPLAEVFLTRARRALGLRRPSLSPKVRAALAGAAYPRNLSELKWVMEVAAVVSGPDEVMLDALPASFSDGAESFDDLRVSLKNAEKEALLHALARTRWNVSAAARMLGLPRRTVVYRMSRLGLRRPARG